MHGRKMFELEVLRTVIQRLEETGIPYMLTGSVAANYYAVPRMTRDMDIVIELEETDIPILTRLLSKDFFVDDEAVREAVKQKSLFNVIHQKTIIKVDFIIRKSSFYRQVEFKRRQRVSFEDFSFWIVSVEDLILSKLEWAKESLSEMQLRDVKNLMSCPNIDQNYLEEWCSSLGLKNILEKALC